MAIAVSNDLANSRGSRVSMRTRPRHVVPSLLFACFAFYLVGGGCGVLDNTTRLDVAFERTGTLQSDGVYEPMHMSTVKAISVGDSQNNLAKRAFISISLSRLPANAKVTKALLQFKASAPAGNPFGDFVTLSIEHVDVVLGIGVDDFTAIPVTSGEATVAPVPTFEKKDVSIDVTEELKNDLAAGRPISSYRLKFGQAPTVDGQADAVFIDASADDSTQRPSMLVTLGQ